MHVHTVAMLHSVFLSQKVKFDLIVKKGCMQAVF